MAQLYLSNVVLPDCREAREGNPLIGGIASPNEAVQEWETGWWITTHRQFPVVSCIASSLARFHLKSKQEYELLSFSHLVMSDSL